jgi:hypothetical protein
MSSVLCILFALPGYAGLGTSAAVDKEGNVWIAYSKALQADSNVEVMRFNAERNAWSEPLTVTARPEPVSDDGENRPKLAFGPKGEMYVTWTSPTSAKYTGDIRFARSLDGGKTWSTPTTVHRDRQLITHRFESLAIDPSGRLWVTWIDKRDLHRAQTDNADYAGAAIYYAFSNDQGASWQGDFKLADHSCECCRIAMAFDASGRPAAFWRHVFAGDERDHAFAWLSTSEPPVIQRATHDRWAIDACPHHGPSLAIAADGTRHAVWFNQLDGESQVFYGQLDEPRAKNVRNLPAGAAHADVAVAGDTVALAWKRFDGTATRIETWISYDSGRQFADGPTLETKAASDQPRLVTQGSDVLLVWRQTTQTSVIEITRAGERVSQHAPRRTVELGPDAGVGDLRTFEQDTLRDIEQRYRGRPFWVLLWDLECSYCFKSMQHATEAQRRNPSLAIVTIATDSIGQADALRERLATLRLSSEAYAFSNAAPESLRFAIDPGWAGEKPRAYRYSGAGERQAISGVLTVEQLIRP